MSWFRKKLKIAGKGTEEMVSLRKELEALNVTPVDYKYTYSYGKFLEQAEKRFKETIQKTNIDDMCDDMLDYYIDSIVGEAKASAKLQYTNHIHVIEGIKGLLDGQIKKATEHLANLKEDLKGIEETCQVYKKIQKEKNIY